MTIAHFRNVVGVDDAKQRTFTVLQLDNALYSFTEQILNLPSEAHKYCWKLLVSCRETTFVAFHSEQLIELTNILHLEMNTGKTSDILIVL